MYPMKRKLILLLLASHGLLLPQSYAVYDPLSVPNNRYGIHVADLNDIPNVKDLVNSTNGDWGYVTIVIPQSERKIDVWQRVFTRMKRDHLIPIVRLATRGEGGIWAKPSPEDADAWADFLDALPWPTKNRYVVLFNEPNHAKEWGGEIRPDAYADALLTYSRALKEKSADFFVLPAGLDASAPNGKDTMDEELFLRWMLARHPDLFEHLDGWTSHSYPNPGFSGSPYAQGRGTIRTFEWELALLSSLGVAKKFPVFITETGWSHARVSPEEISRNLAIAARSVWNHPQIVAVTPFLFHYQDPLFAMFSWLKPISRDPYPFYHAYRQVAKVRGEPLTDPSEEYLALLSQPLTL